MELPWPTPSNLGKPGSSRSQVATEYGKLSKYHVVSVNPSPSPCAPHSLAVAAKAKPTATKRSAPTDAGELHTLRPSLVVYTQSHSFAVYSCTLNCLCCRQEETTCARLRRVMTLDGGVHSHCNTCSPPRTCPRRSVHSPQLERSRNKQLFISFGL